MQNFGRITSRDDKPRCTEYDNIKLDSRETEHRGVDWIQV